MPRSSAFEEGGAVAGSGRAAISAARRLAAAPADGSAAAGVGDKRALRPSAAATWTPAQVAEWLAVLGLADYAPVFSANAMSGMALLDLVEADLDYMGVKPLGHRKLLIRGVGQLRAACGLSASAPAAAPVPAEAEGSARVHWSHTQPLPAPAASASGASLADGGFDEAVEASAFTAAVMAWRKGAAASGKPSAATGLAGMGGGTWSDPFGGGSGGGGGLLLDGPSVDEEAEARAFQEALMAWRTASSASSTSGATRTTASASASSSSGPWVGSRSVCYNCLKQFFTSAAGSTAGLRPCCSATCAAASAAAGSSGHDGAKSAAAASASSLRQPPAEHGPHQAGPPDTADEAGQSKKEGEPRGEPCLDSLAEEAEAAAIAAVLERVAALEAASDSAPRAARASPAAVISVWDRSDDFY